jgi:hypothetical protein
MESSFVRFGKWKEETMMVVYVVSKKSPHVYALHSFLVRRERHKASALMFSEELS